MSKQYKIRWKQDDEARLRKAVKNFNAKITRQLKKDPTLKNVLPEKVALKELKDLIETRADLNREIKSLERFTKINRGKTKSGKPKAQPHDIVTIPGTEYNLKTTRWQLNEMKRSKTVIDAKRQARHDELYHVEQTHRGQKLGYTAGQIGMGRIDENALKPINIVTRFMTQTEFHKKAKTLRKERQSTYWANQEEQMKQNYIKGLKENYKYDDVKEVIDHIEQMPFDEFFDVWKSDRTIFEYSSGSPNKAQYDGYVEQIHSTWLRTESRNKTNEDPNSNQVKPQETQRSKQQNPYTLNPSGNRVKPQTKEQKPN